jgi:hypothetical protein
MNAIQEEICNIIERELGSGSLNGESETYTDMDQLDSAIEAKLKASRIENDSGVTGTNVNNALDNLKSTINNLSSDDIDNNSSVSGASVTDALTQLLNDLNALDTTVSGLHGTDIEVNNSDIEGTDVSTALWYLNEAIGNVAAFAAGDNIETTINNLSSDDIGNDSAVPGTHSTLDSATVTDALNALRRIGGKFLQGFHVEIIGDTTFQVFPGICMSEDGDDIIHYNNSFVKDVSAGRWTAGNNGGALPYVSGSTISFQECWWFVFAILLNDGTVDIGLDIARKDDGTGAGDFIKEDASYLELAVQQEEKSIDAYRRIACLPAWNDGGTIKFDDTFFHGEGDFFGFSNANDPTNFSQVSSSWGSDAWSDKILYTERNTGSYGGAFPPISYNDIIGKICYRINTSYLGSGEESIVYFRGEPGTLTNARLGGGYLQAKDTGNNASIITDLTVTQSSEVSIYKDDNGEALEYNVIGFYDDRGKTKKRTAFKTDK